MCHHTDFEIIYYKRGVMLRKCCDCGQVELRTDYSWIDAEDVKVAIVEFVLQARR